MRFMVIMKGSDVTESGQQPSAKLLEEMTAFNEELVKAGVMLAGEGLLPSSQGAKVEFSGDADPRVIDVLLGAEGLHPSSKGARIRIDGDKRTVVDGPFAETKELVAGFWILQCRDLQECVEWVKRVPNTDGFHHQIEIRRVAEASDFENLSPEVAETEARLRSLAEGQS